MKWSRETCGALFFLAGMGICFAVLIVSFFQGGELREAFGAALATVIAQGVSFLTSLIYLYRRRAGFGFDFSLQNFHPNKVELITLIKLGVPMAIRSASILFSAK